MNIESANQMRCGQNIYIWNMNTKNEHRINSARKLCKWSMSTEQKTKKNRYIHKLDVNSFLLLCTHDAVNMNNMNATVAIHITQNTQSSTKNVNSREETIHIHIIDRGRERVRELCQYVCDMNVSFIYEWMHQKQYSCCRELFIYNSKCGLASRILPNS